MLGASRGSLAGLEEYLSSLFDKPSARGEFAEAGRNCLDAADILEGDAALRSSAADPARSAAVKQDLAHRVFADRVSPTALGVLDHVFGAPWSSPSDLLDAVENGGWTLLLMNAEVAGRIEEVEEEIFRFGRAIDANPPLQMALTDPSNTPEQKAGIVRSLLQGRTAPEVPTILGHLAAHLRGRRMQDAVAALSELAAARHGRVVADVRCAVRLTPDQERRMTAALARLHGRQVELNVIIDESVIGGVEVRVGDEVIDGTVVGRLDQARRQVSRD